MKQFLKQVAEHLLDFLIGTIISLIGTFLATNYTPFLSEISEKSIQIAVAIFLIIMILCFFLIGFMKNAYRYIFHFSMMNVVLDYTGNRVKITSDYCVSTYRIFQTQMYTRRTWFSNEQFRIKVSPKSFKLKQIRKTGNDHEYYIIFPQKHSFWQRPLTFKIVFLGENTHRQFESFYETKILCPVKKLVFDIRIPEDMCSSSATVKAFRNHEDEARAEHKTLDYNCGFRYEVTKPKTGHSYKIEWQWTGAEQHLRNNSSRQ